MSSRMTKPTKWHAQKEDADQPGICPVWSVFAIRMKNLALLATHWVRSLRWVHRSFYWLHVKLGSNSTNGTEVQTNEHMNGRTKKRKLYTPRHKCWGIMKKSTSWLGTSSNMWAAAWQNQQNNLCAERRHRSALVFARSNQSSLSAWRTLYF